MDAAGLGLGDHRENGSPHLQQAWAPLVAAFGQNAVASAFAFLAGARQRWFQQLGPGNDLVVRQTSDINLPGCVDFRLGR